MLKTLLSHLREFKRVSILTPIFVVLEVVMEVLIPLMMAAIIDNGVEKGNMAYVYRTGLLMVLMAMLSLFFGACAGRLAAKASSGFARNLRHDMFENIQTFNFKSIDKFSTASLVTRLTTDVSNVQNAFQMMTRMAFRAPVMLFFALFMTFSVGPSICKPLMSMMTHRLSSLKCAANMKASQT